MARQYNPRVVTRWAIFLDSEASPDAREEAWRALRLRILKPVLFQLRRRIEGWRKTEELAEEVCERVRERFEGTGAGAEAACLRAGVAAELARFLEEQGKASALDAEFERDWAASLFAAALQEFGRQDPEAQRVMLRLFDRPEGVPPMTALELARRLGRPPAEIERLVDEGRRELRELFEKEIGQTAADPRAATEETRALLPRARALFE